MSTEGTPDEDDEQSGLGLSGPPETTNDDSDDSDDVQEVETLDCPHCGADTGDPPEFFQEDHRYRCTECKEIWRGSP